MQPLSTPARPLVEEVLEHIRAATVVVIGDFFLDEYLWLDPALSETSLETGLEAYQVVRRQRQPGAAGTVVSNLCALGVGHVLAVGLCGRDGEGVELRRSLEAMGVDTGGLIEVPGCFTPTYTKPMLMQPGGIGRELSRLDHKNRSAIASEAESQIVAALRAAAGKASAIIVADQVQEPECGVVTTRVRSELADLGRQRPDLPILVDSRTRIGLFENVLTKPNEHELAGLFDAGSESLPAPEASTTCSSPEMNPTSVISLGELAAMGQELSRRTGRTVFATCGVRGILVCSVLDADLSEGVVVEGPVDIVGAGDSATAGIVCGLLGGLKPAQAAGLGNLVASITVQRLGATGTASPDELLARASDRNIGLQTVIPEWRQRPWLGGIELVRRTPPHAIRAALFDFDGTLSLIRRGWQDVMIPFMVDELLALKTGETRDVLHTIVREFVFRLTGKQTIYQMIQLADEVRRRGGRPLDPQEYKDEYHRRLWAQIRTRVEGLKSGQIAPSEFMVPGSLDLLRSVRECGAELYLASGTDIGYVRDEAGALGLLEFFGPHVYGALPQYEQFSKQKVIQQILTEHSLAGPDLVGFGDAYVEIENTRAAGGRTVGVAADEMNPGRLDTWKRNRLIAAGADLIVADFSEVPLLIDLLTGH